MRFDFKGFNENVLTFKAGENVTKGALVSVESNSTVNPASASGEFIGVCVSVDDGVAAVQVKGYAEIPYVDNLTYNNTPVASNGSGAIKQYANAKNVVKVIKIDSENHIAGIIL